MFNVLTGFASGTGTAASEQGCWSTPGELLLVIPSVAVFKCLIKVNTIALCPAQSKIFLFFGQGSDVEIRVVRAVFFRCHYFFSDSYIGRPYKLAGIAVY